VKGTPSRAGGNLLLRLLLCAVPALLLRQFDDEMPAIVRHHEIERIARLDGNGVRQAVENMRPTAWVTRRRIGRRPVLVACVLVEFEPDPLGDSGAGAGAGGTYNNRTASHRERFHSQIEAE